MKVKLSVDRPNSRTPARCYDGWLEFTGWAAADVPITRLRLRLDQGAWHDAVHFGARPDVEAAHPRLAHSGRSGFRAYAPLPQNKPPRSAELEVTTATDQKVVSVACDFEIRHIPLGADDVRHCAWCGSADQVASSGQQLGPFAVQRCEACDYAWAGPWPSAADLRSVYEIEYWHHAPGGADFAGESRDTGFVTDTIRRHAPDATRVFEMGCGQGTLLNGLHRAGFRVEGQDLSANSARGIEQALGITVWRRPLDQIPPDTYDAIVSRHVLEHSVTPFADLRWLRERLAPGGLLILLTPNWRSVCAELLGTAWEWFVPPIHLSYFSPRSMRHAQVALGFDLVDMHTREGDAVPLRATMQAFLDCRGDTLTEATRARLQAVARSSLAAAERDAPERIHLTGQELVTVLRAPSRKG